VFTPEARLAELWEWFENPRSNREQGNFPTDSDLSTLSKQLDARICLMRDADSTRRVRTFVIEPQSHDLRGVQFVFSRREIVVPERREDGAELSVRAASMDPAARARLMSIVLAGFGVSDDKQIERGGVFVGHHASAAPGSGVGRLDFVMGGGANYSAIPFQVPEDLPPLTLLGSRTEFVLLEGAPREDFEFILEIGRDPERAESKLAVDSLRQLWDKWLVAKPHGDEESEIVSDGTLVRAGRDVRGIVGLLRVASGDLVSYGLQMELRRAPLNGLRVLASTPEFDLRSRFDEDPFGLSALASQGEERMLIRLWPERTMLNSTRANMMGRGIGCLEPGFDLPADAENGDGFVNVGRSEQVLAENIKIFLSHVSNRAS